MMNSHVIAYMLDKVASNAAMAEAATDTVSHGARNAIAQAWAERLVSEIST